jgi:hypothetical protein
MRIVFEAMRQMIIPLCKLLVVQLLIYYIFALFGMLMFGGKITLNNPYIVNSTGIPNSYVMQNYNDFISAMITLFSLMVVNNWMVQVQMVVGLMEGNRYYRIYFILFFYISVIIGINIVVAFILDMYSSVENID